MADTTADQPAETGETHRTFGRLRQRIRSPSANVDIYEAPGNLPSAYADGVANVALGAAVSKIDFFQVSELTQENVEIRTLAFRLTIPTQSLIDMTINIFTSLKRDDAAALRALAANVERMRAILDSISIKSPQ